MKQKQITTSLKTVLLLFLFGLLIWSCQTANNNPSPTLLNHDGPAIEGKPEFLNSSYVTAGNRLYMVGNQDGSFPELGWHIDGEMGGIWNHPIKLMDGFDISINGSPLNNASSFTNFPMANKHQINLTGLEITRMQFVPDDLEGLIIQLSITNKKTRPEQLNIQFEGHADLRPTWLGERSNMIDSPDLPEFNKETSTWTIKDSLNTWYVKYGSSYDVLNHEIAESTYKGLGVSTALNQQVTIPANETFTLNYYIAGSYTSEDNLERTFATLQTDHVALFKSKKERYEMLAQQTKLTIPDKQLQQTFEWLKYNADWLIREVPEIGTGIGAGIPDYPWWFGVDSEYALKGYMAVGQDEIVYKTIKLIDSLSQVTNGNGRIIHEVSTNGVVFNPGNINETPQFASLIWEVFKWNGDTEFLKRYYPTIQAGLNWLMEENDPDNNLFPDGFGMMEIHGLNSEMIDVASYTQRAFADASNIATVLGDDEKAAEYRKTAEEMKYRINAKFWSPQFNSFADFIGTKEQGLHLIEDAIHRADSLKKPWAVKELKATKETIETATATSSIPFVVHHNWVVNTPMEMNIADSEKAITALETAKQFVNPYGMFVTGIDRDESAGTDERSFKGGEVFSYIGAVMTLPTGVQAVAENNYGRPNEALDYLKRMSKSFSFALPGSMYEVSPDYGMMVQAWNIYSFAIPIVQQFFGIQPDAFNKIVRIVPQMPDDWDNASLENVKIADNNVSISLETDAGIVTWNIKQTNSEWKLHLVVPSDQFEFIEGSIQPEMDQGNMLFSTSSNFSVRIRKL